MERRIGGLELQTCVRLADLTPGLPTRTVRAVAMTLEADFIKESRVAGFAARKGYAGNVPVGAPHGPAHRGTDGANVVRLHGMGVVTIHALHVTSHSEWNLCRIMDPRSEGKVVGRSLPDVSRNVERSHRAAVTIQAVVFIATGSKQTLVMGRGVNLVAV